MISKTYVSFLNRLRCIFKYIYALIACHVIYRYIKSIDGEHENIARIDLLLRKIRLELLNLILYESLEIG